MSLLRSSVPPCAPEPGMCAMLELPYLWRTKRQASMSLIRFCNYDGHLLWSAFWRILSPSLHQNLLPIDIDSAIMDRANNERVAIIGMSCTLPEDINDADGLWNYCARGQSSASEIPASRFESKNF